MKNRPLTLMIYAGLLTAVPLAGQCQMAYNVSVYSDGSASADQSMVYGYSSTVDDSTRCNCGHGNYQTTATLISPNGAQVSSTQGSMVENVYMPTNGVSGTYLAKGTVQFFCSCFGWVGGGGSASPIQVLNCPLYVTLANTLSIPLEAGRDPVNNFPGMLTGGGILTTMLVGPLTADYTGSQVSEALITTQNSCPSAMGNQCAGSMTWTIGQNTEAGETYGWPFPALGLNEFYDEHYLYFSQNVLGLFGVNQCAAVCYQTYYACGKPIGNFTINRNYTQSTINGTGVTLVEVTKQ